MAIAHAELWSKIAIVGKKILLESFIEFANTNMKRTLCWQYDYNLEFNDDLVDEDDQICFYSIFFCRHWNLEDYETFQRNYDGQMEMTLVGDIVDMKYIGLDSTMKHLNAKLDISLKNH